MSNYPDTMSGSDYCHVEGCEGKGPCPRCGNTDYAWMGYWGAVARWAKEWGVSENETQSRFHEHAMARTEETPESTEATDD